MTMIKLKSLLKCLGISLGVGVLSAIINMRSMKIYNEIVMPSLAPPAMLFPIVWTILFILMGISSYLICISYSDNKAKALAIYAAQLILNFIWSPVFFGLNMYLLALVILLVLWVMVLWMISEFYKIDKLAAFLQIPYILWLTFAVYLNFAIYILN